MVMAVAIAAAGGGIGWCLKSEWGAAAAHNCSSVLLRLNFDDQCFKDAVTAAEQRLCCAPSGRLCCINVRSPGQGSLDIYDQCFKDAVAVLCVLCQTGGCCVTMCDHWGSDAG
jgi:hypothetical protein